MAKSISIAKQCPTQGSPTGRLHRIRLKRPDDPAFAHDLHKNAQILTKPRKRTANRRRIVRT
jgi:hypothetical protein